MSIIQMWKCALCSEDSPYRSYETSMRGINTNMQYCLHVESKRRHSELPYGTETDPQTPLSSQQRTDSPRGRAGGEGMEWDLGISKLVCEEQINHKVLLWSTGNHIHSSEINHNGKECEKEYICRSITESLLNSRKLAQHCKSTIL